MNITYRQLIENVIHGIHADTLDEPINFLECECGKKSIYLHIKAILGDYSIA